MKGSQFEITSKQLIFMITGAQIATGILSLPRVASKDAGQDAWIAVLLGAFLPLVSILLIERLCRKFPSLNFSSMTREIFGKYLGFVLVIGFVIYVMAFEAVVVRLFVEITYQFALPETPRTVIQAMIVLAVVYVAGKGGKVVGRVNELIFYIRVLLFAFLIVNVVKGSQITNLLPIGGSGILSIMKGSLATSYAYAGVESLLVFYFMVNRKNEVLKAAIIALSITTSVYVITTLIAVLVFGAEVLQIIIWPVLVLLKAYEVAIIERLEFIFLVFWLGLSLKPAINMTCAGGYALIHLLGLGEVKWYFRMIIGIGMGIFALALIPANILEAFEFADWAGYAFLIISLGYPLLYLVVASLRGSGVKANA